MPRIGITGGPGTGKSTVLAFLRSEGYSVVSADEISRSLTSDGYAHEIASLCGLTLPLETGLLRRRLLTDPDAVAVRRKVNRLLHGPIFEAMVKSGATYWEVPLAIESCIWSEFDALWIVSCPYEVQEERLLKRYGDAEVAKALIASQLNPEVKRIFCQAEIRTDQPLDHVRFLTLECALRFEQ